MDVYDSQFIQTLVEFRLSRHNTVKLLDASERSIKGENRACAPACMNCWPQQLENNFGYR